MDELLIKELVKNYQKAIHTQNKEDFYSLWSKDEENTLISITNKFIGLDTIYQDFLINGIQRNYLTIDLIAEKIDIHFVTKEIAIVVFQYHTECIRREDQSPYGIQGLETQVVIKKENEWKLTHIHYSK